MSGIITGLKAVAKGGRYISKRFSSSHGHFGGKLSSRIGHAFGKGRYAAKNKYVHII